MKKTFLGVKLKTLREQRGLGALLQWQGGACPGPYRPGQQDLRLAARQRCISLAQCVLPGPVQIQAQLLNLPGVSLL